MTYTLLDFYSSGCVPCKTLLPVLDYVEKQRPQVTVRRIDVAENSDLVQQYGVTSVPTLVLLKGDRVYKTIKGAPPKVKLVMDIEEWLSA